VSDFILDGEDIGQVAIEALGPNLRGVFAVDQLPVTRTRAPDLRTLPSTIKSTPSSRPICCALTILPL
jgi:hypothetical protein